MKISEVFLHIIQFHATIKLYHFQTKNYGAHRASDKLFDKISLKYDQFLEVYQGKHGRIPPINANIQIKSVSDKNIKGYCKHFVEFMRKATKETCKLRKNSDLCNILDEMIADINQFIYLLSFK